MIAKSRSNFACACSAAILLKPSKASCISSSSVMSKIDGDHIGDVAAVAVDTDIFGPPPGGGGGGGYPLLNAADCVGGLDVERFGVPLYALKRDASPPGG